MTYNILCSYKYSCILGYPTGYSQPNTPIKWNAKKCGADIIVVRHEEPLPDSRTDISGSSCPPSPTTGAGAQKPKVRQSPETDAARRRARQIIREYELIWLLQQRLRAVCSVLASSLALALHAAATARPRHGSCQTLVTLTRRPLSVSRALHVLSSCVLCLAPPAVDLLKALDRCVCTRRACCFCLVFVYIALLLLPLSFVLGVGAPSLSLVGFNFVIKAVRRGS